MLLNCPTIYQLQSWGKKEKADDKREWEAQVLHAVPAHRQVLTV